MKIFLLLFTITFQVEQSLVQYPWQNKFNANTLISHLYGAHPIMYAMYGRHPAMLSNLILNSFYSPAANPQLYEQMGGPFGPMSPQAQHFMSPMMQHWMNPMVNPFMSVFSPYQSKDLVDQKQNQILPSIQDTIKFHSKQQDKQKIEQEIKELEKQKKLLEEKYNEELKTINKIKQIKLQNFINLCSRTSFCFKLFSLLFSLINLCSTDLSKVQQFKLQMVQHPEENELYQSLFAKNIHKLIRNSEFVMVNLMFNKQTPLFTVQINKIGQEKQ